MIATASREAHRAPAKRMASRPDTITGTKGRDDRVGVLQRFERRLGGIVEGAFAKVFKGEVQPVEIASALQRETDDKKAVVGQGRVLVPNDFVVELGDHDYERLSPWAEPLGKELATMVEEHAQEQTYSFVGPVRVQFELSGDLDTGMFRVRSGVASGPVTSGGEERRGAEAASDIAAAGPPPPGPDGNPRLVIASGGHATRGSAAARGEEAAFFLTNEVTVVGRGADADLRLPDSGVSRRHAEIRREDSGHLLVDLGSTNGTRVNDSRVAMRRLANGDRIEVGSTTLIYRSGA